MYVTCERFVINMQNKQNKQNMQSMPAWCCTYACGQEHFHYMQDHPVEMEVDHLRRLNVRILADRTELNPLSKPYEEYDRYAQYAQYTEYCQYALIWKYATPFHIANTPPLYFHMTNMTNMQKNVTNVPLFICKFKKKWKKFNLKLAYPRWLYPFWDCYNMLNMLVLPNMLNMTSYVKYVILYLACAWPVGHRRCPNAEMVRTDMFGRGIAVPVILFSSCIA